VDDWALLRLRQRAPTSLPQQAESPLLGTLSCRGGHQRRRCSLGASSPGAHPRCVPCEHPQEVRGTPPAAPPPLPDINHGAIVPVPARVEQVRLARGVRQVLVHWQGEPSSSATWEDLDDFREKYPAFQLEDELDLEGGGGRCHVGPHVYTLATGP
jgi:hypothetical protein